MQLYSSWNIIAILREFECRLIPKQRKGEENMEVKVDKVFVNTPTENSSKVGTASITIEGGFGVRDISIMDGEKGLWVSFPSRPKKDKNGEVKTDENGKAEYMDIAFPTKAETREQIVNAILEAYKKEKEQAENK